MQIRILGPLEVAEKNGRVVEIGGRRERAILALLALNAGRVVSADRLIDEVWADDLPANPANALQVRVSRLRKAVGDALVTRAPGYVLDIGPGDVDAARFESLVSRADGEEPAAAIATLDEALALVRGEPLADLAADGALGSEAARLIEVIANATEQRIAARLEIGAARELVPELESLVAAHPLRESLRASLMLALYRSGRQADALRVYGDGRRLLAEELGIEPGAELQTLEERILLQDSGLDSGEAASTRIPASRRGPRRDLPARLTSFFGRESEIEEVRELTRASRLVTIVGPGGAGKTSLALAVAHRAPTDTDALLVELAPLTDDGSVVGHIAESLGLDPGPRGDTPMTVLRTYLAARPAVAVIDNCEHVLDGAAATVEQLLVHCPQLTVIATSRARLGVPGERLFHLSGLEPAAGAELFLNRAAELGVPIDADDAVGEIVEALDGMPLAIELAAALTPTLAPVDIAKRLDQRFELLTGGPRTALPRHQTLRAAIDWSYELLDDEAARLFRALSVVRAGFDVPLAAALGQLTEAAAVRLVGALVDRSMVVRLDDGRFQLLDTLRVYGFDRLAEAGEEPAALDRFAGYFETLAAAAEGSMRGTGQLEWAQRLRPHRDNLRHGVEAALMLGDVDRALLQCARLGYFWFVQSLIDEELRLVDRALGLGGSPVPRARAIQAKLILTFLQSVGRQTLDLFDLADEAATTEDANGASPDRRMAHALRGIAHAMAGDLSLGAALMETTLTEAIEVGDAWVEGLLRAFSSAVRAYGTDVEMRPEPIEAAVRCFRREGDHWMLAFTLGMQAATMRQMGDYETALALYGEAHQHAATLGSRWMEANSLVETANVYTLLGDPDRALELLAEAQPLVEPIGAPGLIAHVANSSGFARRLVGDLDAALEDHARALRIYRDAGGQGGEALALDRTGYVLQLLDRHAEAGECHRQAFELSAAARDPLAMALSVEGLAGVAATIGDATEAALLVGGAERLRGSMGVPLVGAERWAIDVTIEVLRDRLGRGLYEETVERGRMLDDAQLAGLVRGAG